MNLKLMAFSCMLASGFCAVGNDYYVDSVKGDDSLDWILNALSIMARAMAAPLACIWRRFRTNSRRRSAACRISVTAAVFWLDAIRLIALEPVRHSVAIWIRCYILTRRLPPGGLKYPSWSASASLIRFARHPPFIQSTTNSKDRKSSCRRSRTDMATHRLNTGRWRICGFQSKSLFNS